MSHCQYELTSSREGLSLWKCAFCDREVWKAGDVPPFHWCRVRPDVRPVAKCRYRSLEQIDSRLHRLCGCKGKMEPVFWCHLHWTETTLEKIEHNQKSRVCLGCMLDGEGYHAIDSDRPRLPDA